MQHWPDVVLWGQTGGVIFVVFNSERWKQKRKRNGNIWLLRWCVCGVGGGGGLWWVIWAKNKNALTAAYSLPRLEIRSRNEEAINSTRNRIYSLKVFYFLLYRRRVFLRMFTFYLFLNWFGTRGQRRQEIRLWSHPTQVYKNTKIQRPWLQRNYIIARDQKSDLHATSFQLLPKINRVLITRPFAYNNEILQHPSIAVFFNKDSYFFPTTL